MVREKSERKRLPEAIGAFFSKVESDENLQAKLRKISLRQELEYLTAVNKVVQMARREGFVFTPEEFLKVRLWIVEGKGELPSEEDLEDVQKMEECCHYAQGCMPGFCPIVEG